MNMAMTDNALLYNKKRMFIKNDRDPVCGNLFIIGTDCQVFRDILGGFYPEGTVNRNIIYSGLVYMAFTMRPGFKSKPCNVCYLMFISVFDFF